MQIHKKELQFSALDYTIKILTRDATPGSFQTWSLKFLTLSGVDVANADEAVRKIT